MEVKLRRLILWKLILSMIASQQIKILTEWMDCYIRIECCTLGGIYLQYDIFFLRRDLKGVVMDFRDDDKGRGIIFST